MSPRTAITIAAEIYDKPRDLLRYEQDLLTAVHRITMDCARTKGEAIRAWGDRSRASDAVAFLADSKCADHLCRALERYDVAVDAMDEVEEAVVYVDQLEAAK
jgi:hypothetical protein